MIGIFASAIILGPPPKPLLDRSFASIRQHLTKDQLKARAARQNCGKPGRRKGEPTAPAVAQAPQIINPKTRMFDKLTNPAVLFSLVKKSI